MQENRISLQPILDLKEKIIHALHDLDISHNSDNVDLNVLYQSLMSILNNKYYLDFMAENPKILNDLLSIYNSLPNISTDKNLYDLILNRIINIDHNLYLYEKKEAKEDHVEDKSSNIYEQLNNTLKSVTSLESKTNDIANDITKKYTSIISMESQIKDLLKFYDKTKIADIKTKINDLLAASKKISTDDIDNLNYAIKDTKNKAHEIQKLEDQLNKKLTDWNSEHKDDLVKKYTDLKEKFEEDIKNITQEVESIKAETTTKIEQNIEQLSSEYKKKFDDGYIKFNKIHENNQERYQKLYDNVTENLANLNNEIQKEELAQYFQLECKKLKGKINPLIIAFSLFLTMIFSQILLKTDWYNNLLINLEALFKPIVSFVSIWFISLIITQFIYNSSMLATKDDEHSNTNEIPTNTNKKSIFNQDTIKELLTPYWCWLVLIFIGLYFIGHISYTVYNKNINNEIQSFKDILPNMPFFMIMVWFTWFASKQFSYIKQICDEYEYKYALSKSYLSYKKEASELSTENKSLLVSLLDSVIRNISTSPVQSVKADCHTPFGEVFNSLKSASDIIKKDKTTP